MIILVALYINLLILLLTYALTKATIINVALHKGLGRVKVILTFIDLPLPDT